MEWLEMVSARTELDGDAYGELVAQFQSPTDIPGLVDARIFRQVSVPNALMILLTWNSAVPQTWGSDLALGLIAELRKHGLVDHSIWHETTM